MDFIEKAEVRINHWIKHNQDHLEEYESFALELESKSRGESAQQIREMTALIKKSNDCLRRALETL